MCNMLPRGMKDDSGKANEQYSDLFHDDEGRKRQDDFSVDVRNLVDALPLDFLGGRIRPPGITNIFKKSNLCKFLMDSKDLYIRGSVKTYTILQSDERRSNRRFLY